VYSTVTLVAQPAHSVAMSFLVNSIVMFVVEALAMSLTPAWCTLTGFISQHYLQSVLKRASAEGVWRDIAHHVLYGTWLIS